MRLYEDRNKKRQIQCNYCHHEGHNKRNCPTMKAQWLANPQVHETYDRNGLTAIDKTMFPVHYQHYWGDDDARRQFRSHWRYMKNNFVYVLKQTNKAYRAAYYDKFVEGMGLGAGALVSAQGYDGESMGIITSFPTEQIMFTNIRKDSQKKP